MLHASAFELGKYTLIGEIARGGMGIVYLAQVQGPGGFKKTVVIKELKSELADDPKFRDMFLEEANLAARLNHRNIVQTNEVGESGGRYYMAMDYLEGCSLHTARKRLTGDRAMPLSSQLRVITEVLAGLHYAHELTDYDGTAMGVVHRDVGPQNIFLTYDGQVKLIDFGVAKVLNRQQETQAGVLKGRVAYMAPEQVSGASIDRRADIFSTGLVLREVITGQRIWDGLGEIDTLKKLIARDIPPFPADIEVAAELREICEKATAPQRDDRFKTAHEMRVQLDQYVARAHPTSSLADLGAHLSRELAAERKKLKDILDGHLGSSSARLAVGDLLAPGSSPDLGSLPPAIGSGVRSGSLPAPSRPTKTPASGTVVSGDVPDIEVHVDPSAASSASSLRRNALIAGIAVTAIAILVIVAGRRRADHGSDSSATAVARAESPSAAPAGAAPPPAAIDDRGDTIDVAVRVTPANAQIFVDDARVDGNPYHGRFPRNGGATHEIRATAPGFNSRTELVRFDANANVAISLERQVAAAFPAAAARPDPRASTPPPPPPPATPQAVTSPKSSSTDINPRGGKVPKRDIDPKNPYGAPQE